MPIPSNLAVSSATTTTVTLTWGQIDGAVVAGKVISIEAAIHGTSFASPTIFLTVDSTTTSFTATGLAAGERYDFRLRTKSGIDPEVPPVYSSYSNTASGSTSRINLAQGYPSTLYEYSNTG